MKNSLTLQLLALLGILATAPMALGEDAPKGASAAATVNEPLKAGTEAPDFTLQSGTGEQVTLSSFKGKKSVVLYFYPKDNTPGCTKEAEAFRDDYSRFERLDAEVLGVSVDDATSHKFFASKFNLNFPLLADVGGKVARQYGVMGWIMAKRVTFVIGKDGLIKSTFTDVDVTNHSREVLKVLQANAPSEPSTPASAPKSKSKSRGKGKNTAKNS